ncbi:MAG TPA: hypothetical protein ENG45_00910 [Candidatus Aenigmarchaeota archaeon]|nr:hypothetical protein [Candidatus Aenigmarchaeota archaeon]
MNKEEITIQLTIKPTPGPKVHIFITDENEYIHTPSYTGEVRIRSGDLEIYDKIEGDSIPEILKEVMDRYLVKLR